MKKIAFLLYSLDGGGVERMTLHLVQAFLNKGYVVDLLVVNFKGDYVDDVPANARLHAFNKKRVSASIGNLIRYLRKERPDYLISAKDYINVAAIWAKVVARVNTELIVSCRVHLTEQVRNEPKKFKRVQTLIKWSYKKADHVVAVSKGVADDIQAITGVPYEKIHVIYNPVVSEALFARAEEPISHSWFKEGMEVIVTTGRLHKQKDYPTLLKAFQLVARHHSNARLLVVGDGLELKALQKLSESLEIERKVDFVGFQNNPYPYMRMASLFVLSSAWEGFGNVLVEALAVGCPIVSTNCPSGPAEILENGTYGELVPVGNYEKLAQSIITVLNSDINKEELKARANEFTIDRCVEQYEALLK